MSVSKIKETGGSFGAHAAQAAAAINMQSSFFIELSFSVHIIPGKRIAVAPPPHRNSDPRGPTIEIPDRAFRQSPTSPCKRKARHRAAQGKSSPDTSDKDSKEKALMQQAAPRRRNHFEFSVRIANLGG
jgi:hypothetical protein